MARDTNIVGRVHYVSWIRADHNIKMYCTHAAAIMHLHVVVWAQYFLM